MFVAFIRYTSRAARPSWASTPFFCLAATSFSSPCSPSAKSSIITSSMLPSITASFFTMNMVCSMISRSPRSSSTLSDAIAPSR